MYLMSISGLLCAWVLLRSLHRVYSEERQHGWGKTLLLTAHPDDETMFFGPVMHWTRPFILCLSDGNFDGLGRLRRGEMASLCRKLKLKHEILGYADGGTWCHRKVAKDLVDFIIMQKIKTVVTFGRHGVSGHRNHIACHDAARYVQSLIPAELKTGLRFRFLADWGVFQKYLMLFSKAHFTLPRSSFAGMANMRVFATQMVWFRYLYCVFSNYMHANAFTE